MQGQSPSRLGLAMRSMGLGGDEKGPHSADMSHNFAVCETIRSMLSWIDLWCFPGGWGKT